MLKIGEFSKLAKVSVRMLHYYDQIGLLKPIKIDNQTGYRYYSVTQLSSLQKIIMLRDLNFQISEIRNAMNQWSDDTLITLLNNKIDEKQQYILAQQQQIKKIQYIKDSIHQQELDMHYKITIKQIPSQHVISLRRIIPSYQDEGILWKELSEYVKTNHIEILKQNNNNVAIYHDYEYKDSDVDVEVCFLIKRIISCNEPYQIRELEKVDHMACMMVQGQYQNLNFAYQSFLNWLDNHSQYLMNGLNRQICHRDYTNEENEIDYLTEIQIPITISNVRNNE